jgi:hypothetical protein
MARHQRLSQHPAVKDPDMDLIDRYLATVGVLLPLSQRKDILDELRDVLMNHAEEKQAELGRPLNAGEEADLLRAFGHPVAVAARYGRGQYLIGPELFPLYALAVKVFLAFVAVSAVITGIVTAVADPGQPGSGLGAALGVMIRGAIDDIGVLTIIAAVLQHQNVSLKFLNDWNPRDLPKPLRRPIFRPQSRIDHVGGVITQAVFILWWTRVINVAVPYVTYIPLKVGQRLDLSRAPIWDVLFWPVVGLALATLILHLLKLARQADRSFVHGLDLIRDIAALAVVSVALRASHWIEVAGVGIPAQTLAEIAHGVNIGLQVALIVAAVAAACAAAYHAWRLYLRGQGAD